MIPTASTTFQNESKRVRDADVDFSPEPARVDLETTALLPHKRSKMKGHATADTYTYPVRRGCIPSCRTKKRRMVLASLVVISLTAIFSALGGLGVLTRKENIKAPKDGLSPPWYPSPLGGTLPEWEESYRKANTMVEKMTLIEKVNLTTGVGWQMGLCVGNTGPANSVKFPSLCLQDGPLGLRFADNITAFPAGITVGATWNRDLMRKRGKALGKEAHLKGINVMLAPSVGPIGTLPAAGRNWEGFGSDPVLQGVAGAETIQGIQENGVMATIKHLILNEQEHFRQPDEWGIPHAISANIDERTLREVYLWPFAESVRAGVASVMCSYQLLNNSYACGNSYLLNGILKDELGFQGFVQSDWWAQQSGVASALAGLDMTMPGSGPRSDQKSSFWGPNLTLAVLNNSVPMERLNDMATRIVASWYQLEQDKWPKPPPEGDGGPNFSSWTHNRTGPLHFGSDDGATGVINRFINAQGEGRNAHRHIVREVAAEGTVLLKNTDGILPLSKDGFTPGRKTIVGIFGEDAGLGRGPNVCEDRSCNQGTLASGWGSGAVDFPYLISPWQALGRTFNNETVSVSGHLHNTVKHHDLANKDLCIVFANSDSGEGYLADGDIHGDRNNLYLQKGGNELIKHVATQCGNGKGNTIVVIHNVGPVILESFADIDNIKAIVLANLPGQESGNSLADVIFGAVDASGRLPYTIGKSLDDYGPDAKVMYTPNEFVPQKNFSFALYNDYRYFDKHNIEPRYEFGYGLSYTSFKMSKLVLTPLREKSPFPSPRPESLIKPPSYDDNIPDPKTAVFPEGFRRLTKYIYPYITSVDEVKSGKYQYPDGYYEKQTPSPAGGGQGGNPSLFDPFLDVSLTVTNTGRRAGKEVVQLYVSFPSNVKEHNNHTAVSEKESESGGNTNVIEFPVRVLRNFDKVDLQPGQSKVVKMTLTRKDLSYWSTLNGNWVMPVEGRYKIWIGRSSRDFPLMGEF